MQTIYTTASEETKEKIREQAFFQLKNELKLHYPDEGVYLIGRETPNARLYILL